MFLLDITYFSFFNTALRSDKLRFGIVFNHTKFRFELWLMGQNATIQRKYWELLKTAQWNKDQTTMPKYSVLEAVLVENPDFDNLDRLIDTIIITAYQLSLEIIGYIENTQ